MLMTAEQAVRAISETISLSLSDITKIKDAYNALDLKAMKDAALARITTEDWKEGDRAPTGILYEDAHPELKAGVKAYKLFVDGKLVYFQTAHPITGALLRTDDDLADAKAKHADLVAENLVNQQIPEEILKQV